MAMNATNLGAEIVAAIKGTMELTAAQEAEATILWTAVAGAIITHVQTNAVVSTTTTGAATAVTSGGITSPTVGTGTGTVA